MARKCLAQGGVAVVAAEVGDGGDAGFRCRKQPLGESEARLADFQAERVAGCAEKAAVERAKRNAAATERFAS